MDLGGITAGQVVLGLIGGLGGLGGVAALLRVRTQNRTDERKQLTEEQIAFRQSMLTELARLSALQGVSEAAKDKLEVQLAEQGKLIERLQTRDEMKEKQIADLQTANTNLLVRANTQQSEIESLREEKAQVVQRLTVAEAMKEFLERENGDLRREAARLRGELDAVRSGPPHGES